MAKDRRDPMNDRMPPPGIRRGPRKAVYIAIALLVMFGIALAVASTAIGVLDRPGQDPGALDHKQAPAD